jgi:hypothetical protein
VLGRRALAWLGGPGVLGPQSTRPARWQRSLPAVPAGSGGGPVSSAALPIRWDVEAGPQPAGGGGGRGVLVGAGGPPGVHGGQFGQPVAFQPVQESAEL